MKNPLSFSKISKNLGLTLKKQNLDLIEISKTMEEIYLIQSKKTPQIGNHILKEIPLSLKGSLHLGHYLNKVLKDIFNRYKLITGYRIDYNLGFNCYGKLIEEEAMKDEFDKKKPLYINYDNIQIRQICRKYCESKFINYFKIIQKWGLLTDYKRIYLTLMPEFELNVIDIFLQLSKKNLIERNYTQYLWSFSSRCRVSPENVQEIIILKKSIFLKLKVSDYGIDKTLRIRCPNLYFIVLLPDIWFISNIKAIAINPKLIYSIFEKNNCFFLSEDNTMETYFKNEEYRYIMKGIGGKMEGLKLTHPLNDEKIPLLFNPNMYLSKGSTIKVVTPAHNINDYNLAKYFNIERDTLIDKKGQIDRIDVFSQEYEIQIMKKLVKNDIFLCFIKIEDSTYINKSTKETIFPYVLSNIYCKIASNSEAWEKAYNEYNLKDNYKYIEKEIIISEEGIWGIPIPIFYHKREGKKIIIEPEIISHILELFKTSGTEIWFKWEIKKLLPQKFKNLASDLIKSNEIFNNEFLNSSHFFNKNQENSCSLIEGDNKARNFLAFYLFNQVNLTKNNSLPDPFFHKLVESKEINAESLNSYSKQNLLNIFEKNEIFASDIEALRLWACKQDVSNEFIAFSDEIFLNNKKEIENLIDIYNSLLISCKSEGTDKSLTVNEEYKLNSNEISNKNFIFNFLFENLKITLLNMMMNYENNDFRAAYTIYKEYMIRYVRDVYINGNFISKLSTEEINYINSKNECSLFSPEEIIEWKLIDKGTYGKVFKITTKENLNFAIKQLELYENEDLFNEKQEDILKEIVILDFLNQTIQKPRSLPKFYGYFILTNKKTKEIQYNLVFDLKDGSLKRIVEINKVNNKKFKFSEIYSIYKMLINTMTYLQIQNITHRDLKPGNILYSFDENESEIKSDNLTLIDFGGSKLFLSYTNLDNTLILTKRYCSPELMFYSCNRTSGRGNYDPFKSDVFSMGLILIEMGTLKLPFENNECLSSKNYFSEIFKQSKKLAEEFYKNYEKIVKEDEKNKLIELKNCIIDCVNERDKRPDFINLYLKYEKIENQNSEKQCFEIIKNKILDNELPIKKNSNRFQSFCKNIGIDSIFFESLKSEDKSIDIDIENLCERSNLIIKSNEGFNYNNAKYLSLITILESLPMLRFIYIETIRRNFYESDMKNLYFLFKEIRFQDAIKSFVIRAIPHEKLNKDLLYSYWIHYNFHDNNDESKNPFEIKFINYHTDIWSDGLSTQDLDAMQSIISNKFINWDLENLELIYESQSFLKENTINDLTKNMNNFSFKKLKNLQLGFSGNEISDISLTSLLELCETKFMHEKNDFLEKFSFYAYSYKTDLDLCLYKICSILLRMKKIKEVSIFLRYVSSEISFKTLMQTFQYILPSITKLSLGLQADKLYDESMKLLVESIKINCSKNLKNISIFCFSQTSLIETLKQISSLTETRTLDIFNLNLTSTKFKNNDEETWKSKLEQNLKKKNPNCKINIKILFTK